MARPRDRDWSNVDWSKTNAELALEFDVVRGTVHAQRKRYASQALPGGQPDPQDPPLSPPPLLDEEPSQPPMLRVAPPPVVPAQPATVEELAVAQLPAPTPRPTPAREVVPMRRRPVRHWSSDPRVARRLPHGIAQLDALHFRVGEAVFTARVVMDAVRAAGEDWAAGVAAHLGVPWSPEVTLVLEALTDLGILERRSAFHAEVAGGAFVNAYSVRVPREEAPQHAPS